MIRPSKTSLALELWMDMCENYFFQWKRKSFFSSPARMPVIFSLEYIFFHIIFTGIYLYFSANSSLTQVEKHIIYIIWGQAGNNDNELSHCVQSVLCTYTVLWRTENTKWKWAILQIAVSLFWQFCQEYICVHCTLQYSKIQRILHCLLWGFQLVG